MTDGCAIAYFMLHSVTIRRTYCGEGELDNNFDYDDVFSTCSQEKEEVRHARKSDSQLLPIPARSHRVRTVTLWNMLCVHRGRQDGLRGQSRRK